MPAHLFELVLGSLQHMRQDLLFAYVFGICEHVPVMRYAGVKGLYICW